MSELFAPLKVGGMPLNQRIAMAPMTRLRADVSNLPLPSVKSYYQQRANVPGSHIVTEVTVISPRHGGYANVPGIYRNEKIAAWKEVTTAIHENGSYIFLAALGPGSRGQPAILGRTGHSLVSSSDVPMKSKFTDEMHRPNQLTVLGIREAISDFTAATENAILAGFGGVEIHGANGYLVDQFIQDVSNQLTDKWGEEKENRSRLATEVACVVAKAIGSDSTAIRLSPWSRYQGMRMEDSIRQFPDVAQRLAELKLAYLQVCELDVKDKEERIKWLLEAYGNGSPVLIADHDVAVAFDRPYISNPDLAFKVKRGLPLAPFDPAAINLTRVETRLQMLESALGKLFPSGEMEDITRSILADESPRDAPTSVDTDKRIFQDIRFDPDATVLGGAFDATNQMFQAFGSWLSSDNHGGGGGGYYAKAQHQLQQIPLSDKGNITLIQALLLLSDFAQRQGSPEESLHFVGTAVRKAVALDLHIESSNPELTALDKEIRRRVWWATYCAESCSAKIYGRPLILPEDGLMTVNPVTNTHDLDPTSLTLSFPTPTDEPTIYSGLIKQSSYHRMANYINRQLLSSSNITPGHIQRFEQMINEWHSKNPSFFTRLVRVDSVKEWDLTARRRQSLCDQSLRLLIHRPFLLQWLKTKSMDKDSALPAEEYSAEAQCRVKGVTIARNTIGQISEWIIKGQTSRLHLSFTLYALFHALLVPVIHIKGNPSSPESITHIQDIERAKIALKHLQVEGDALSQSFIIVLDRLFAVVSQSIKRGSYQRLPGEDATSSKPGDFQIPGKNIFGNEELAVLENVALKGQSGVDFSEWLN
ncbi:hypothetical protein AAEP93_009995 [Penicillium crustosum]